MFDSIISNLKRLIDKSDRQLEAVVNCIEATSTEGYTAGSRHYVS